MDQVIAANENFIDTIYTQLLLDQKSKVLFKKYSNRINISLNLKFDIV